MPSISLNSEERERALLVYKHFVPTALFPTDSGAGDSLVTRMVVHSFRDGESNVPYERVPRLHICRPLRGLAKPLPPIPGLTARALCCRALRALLPGASGFWVNYLLPSQRERGLPTKSWHTGPHHDLLTFGLSQTYSPLVSPGSASSFAICST